jgi:hypothetical protein
MNMISRALKPQGRVFFIDSRFEPTSSAEDHTLPDKQSTIANRHLNDGREFQIVKIYYDGRNCRRGSTNLVGTALLRKPITIFFYGAGCRSRSGSSDSHIPCYTINPTGRRIFRKVS